MPVYAFFDFDGTLISKDSFLIVLKAAFKKQPWRVLFIILFLPILLPTGIFKLDKTLAKSCLLWSATVFRGKKGAIEFLKKTILDAGDKIWFSQAVAQFEQLQKENVEVIVISASGTMWIRALLRSKFKKTRLIIGSRLGFCCGGVVLKSNNCYKEEKLRRIREILGDNFIWHSAWSDHIADLPMLRMAPLRYIVCPKAQHLEIFKREFKDNFTLLNWTTYS
ncbi:MAG: HAD-IB family phosphatase [Bdellovibrionota bacterium]